VGRLHLWTPASDGPQGRGYSTCIFMRWFLNKLRALGAAATNRCKIIYRREHGALKRPHFLNHAL
jgi:hypothetical protein